MEEEILNKDSKPEEKLYLEEGMRLEAMHSEAEEALSELYRLNEQISELEEELYEVKCVLGI